MYTHIFFGLTNLPYTLAYHALLINFMASSPDVAAGPIGQHKAVHNARAQVQQHDQNIIGFV